MPDRALGGDADIQPFGIEHLHAHLASRHSSEAAVKAVTPATHEIAIRPRMRQGRFGMKLVLTVALFAIAACADNGPVPAREETVVYELPAETPRMPLPRPKPDRPKSAKKSSKTAQAATKATPVEPVEPVTEPEKENWTVERLVGMTEAETRGRLGPPNFAEDAAPSRIWLYAAENCSIRLYFFPEVESLVYRVLRYEVLGHGDGEQCIADLAKADSPAGRATNVRQAS